MDRALVIGEALIDIVERDGRVVGDHIGGSPLNVAVGLARLGRAVDFYTHLGDDPHGRRIADYVGSVGARLVSSADAANTTPTARARVGADGSADYEFDLDWRLTGPADVPPPLLVATGSIAAVREPGCAAVAELTAAHRASATVAFDPNVRPALIDDPPRARRRIEDLVATSDVVKVSDADLRWLYPDGGVDRSVDRIAADWLALGPAIVAVTLGHRGAFGVCAAGRTQVAAAPVAVADTVGAGDAFTVGLLDALWGLGLLGAGRRDELAGVGVEALAGVLRAGSDSAAATVARPGAELPDRAVRGD